MGIVVCQRSCGLGSRGRFRLGPRPVARGSLRTRAESLRLWVARLLRVGFGAGTSAHFLRLSPYPRPSRGGPRQARRPLLRHGGHRAGAAALVEDHGDLPGLVALLPDQWAEFPAGETLMGVGQTTAHLQGTDSTYGPGALFCSSGSWCPSLSCLPESRCRWTIRRSCPSPLCMRERSL